MTIDNISKYLEEGADLSDLTEDGIQALISEHPFSAALRDLLVRKQSQNQHFVLDDLSQAAYFSPQVDQFYTQHFQCRPLLNDSVSAADPEPPVVLPVEPKQPVEADLIADRVVVETGGVIAGSAIRVVESENTNEAPVQSDKKENEGIIQFESLSDYAKWLMSTTSIVEIDQKRSGEKGDRIQNSTGEELMTDNAAAEAITEDDAEEVSLAHEDKSTRYNEQIVSESLAEILVEQGLNQKAIAMYEKLSLIIPEKRAYFAAQIQKIK